MTGGTGMTGTAAAVTERVVVARATTGAGAMRPRSAVFRPHCGVRRLPRLLQLHRRRAQARYRRSLTAGRETAAWNAEGIRVLSADRPAAAKVRPHLFARGLSAHPRRRPSAAQARHGP